MCSRVADKGRSLWFKLEFLRTANSANGHSEPRQNGSRSAFIVKVQSHNARPRQDSPGHAHVKAFRTEHHKRGLVTPSHDGGASWRGRSWRPAWFGTHGYLGSKPNCFNLSDYCSILLSVTQYYSRVLSK